MRYLLSLDVGTTSIKGILFRESGKVARTALEEYRLATPRPNLVELEAEIFWKVCRKVIKNLIDAGKTNAKKIIALAISSQGSTFVPVDKEGNALRPAVVWLDNRSEGEAQFLADEWGIDRIFKVTGQPIILPTWEATKLLWLKKNEPGIFSRAYKFLLIEDYLIYKLTGKFVTEHSLVSDSLFFDIRKREWWEEMLDFLGVSREQLPELKSPGEIVGEVSSRAAKETGLTTSTVVVTGAMDQVAGAIGAGNISPGIVTETTGTALAMSVSVKEPICNAHHGKIPCYCHGCDGLYLLLLWCQTAGMILRWFRDEFCRSERVKAEKSGKDAYNLLGAAAAKISSGSEGLVMLPHLMGASCPEFNPKARGVFFGFTLRHTKAHFIRALMEAVAFMLRRNVETLEKAGIDIDEIRSLGGGAKSPVWTQIKADITQKPLAIMRSQEAGSIGVAMLAGTALGLFSSLEEASKKMVSIKKRIEPEKKNRETYDQLYSVYLRLYDRLADLFSSSNQKD